MHVEERLLRRLEELLLPEYSPAMAYPLRARLARVVNEATRWLSDVSVRPAQIDEAMRNLRDLSSHLMQPSEPFDGRWQEQWMDVRRFAEIVRDYLLADKDGDAGSTVVAND